MLEGYFDVPAEDVYQLQLRGEGRFTVSLDGTKLKQPPDTGKAWRFLPVSLAAGTHRLRVRGKVPKDAHLELRFGGPGAHSLGASQFHYPAGKPGKAEAKAKPKAATGSKP